MKKKLSILIIFITVFTTFVAMNTRPSSAAESSTVILSWEQNDSIEDFNPGDGFTIPVRNEEEGTLIGTVEIDSISFHFGDDGEYQGGTAWGKLNH